MGKRYKKKVQWRRLSLNELEQGSITGDSCAGIFNDEDEKKEISSSSLSSNSQSKDIHHPFPPIFHSGDQKRFPYPYDPRGLRFEKGPSLEHCSYARLFSKSFYQDPRSQFPGPRRKHMQFFGRGGVYIRDTSPSSRERSSRRRWPDDESVVYSGGQEVEIDDQEGIDKPLQPVHTVFIDNEEYTKIQTPRQEVIFKKSSLDKKRDSLDLGSSTSTCESANGCDPNQQGDQTSMTDSNEDATLSFFEESQTDARRGDTFEDANNIFVGEPGKPPLAGVVMQQAYPGGPMISIPVHWTPFLDPGLIPGDTALTPLDPAFTHVIDSKDLTIDPAHILPVQHDSNGCPVTVQVKIDADGLPVEIEPSAFTVSLSTLEPYQQEVLFRKSSSLKPSSSHIQSSNLIESHSQEIAMKKSGESEEYSSVSTSSAEQDQNEVSDESRTSRKDILKHQENEECSSDSQYASMSEESTAPTTPSGEFSEPSESSDSPKPTTEETSIDTTMDKKEKQSIRSFSLIDSEFYELDGDDEVCSFISLKSECEIQSVRNKIHDNKNHSFDSITTTESTHFHFAENFQSNKVYSLDNTLSNLNSEDFNAFSHTGNDVHKRIKRNNKNKDPNIIYKDTSSTDIHINNKIVVAEVTSKYQAKKNARKLKKEKKRCSKDINKVKIKYMKDAKRLPKDIHDLNLKSSLNCNSENRLEIPQFIDKERTSEVSSLTFNVNEKERADYEIPHGTELKVSLTENRDKNITDSYIKEEILQNWPSSTLNNITTETKEIKINESINNNSFDKQDVASKNGINISTTKDDENIICKPGFVMVPILTPYYDPAVLYGYPLVIPENSSERNYNRKKKKKYKKKHYEDFYLDTDLYAGEPFVATPNGYIVPVETSQICNIHGYQYFPNVFPQLLSEEKFSFIDHPYNLTEYVSETLYNKISTKEELEKHSKCFSKLYEGERKEIEDVLHEQISKDNLQIKDLNESCESGVSESEEMIRLTTVKGSQNSEGRDAMKDNQKCNEQNEISKDFRENTTRQEKTVTKMKRKSRKKKKVPNKTDNNIIEILEPSFVSDKSILKFEVSKDEQKKQKTNKIIKKQKMKIAKKENENKISAIIDSLPVVDRENSSFIVNTSENHMMKKQKSPRYCLENNKVSMPSKVKTSLQKNELITQYNGTKSEKKKIKTITAIKTKKLKGFQVNSLVNASESLINKIVDELPEKENTISESILVKKNIADTQDYLNQDLLMMKRDYPINKVNTSKYKKKIIINEHSLIQHKSDSQIKSELNPVSICNESLNCDVCFSECDSLISNNFEISSKDCTKTAHNSEPRNEKSTLDQVDLEYSLIKNIPLRHTDNNMHSCAAHNLSIDNDYIMQKDVLNLDTFTLMSEEESICSFKDLSVTKAVQKWIREVTPEKVFSFSNKTRTMILSEVFDSCNTECYSEKEEISANTYDDQESKNALGNPFDVSSNECSLGSTSERVASLSFYNAHQLLHETIAAKVSSSQYTETQIMYSKEILDIFDLWQQFQCSTSIPTIIHLEDYTNLDNLRVYDRNKYSKYCHFGINTSVATNDSIRSSSLKRSENIVFSKMFPSTLTVLRSVPFTAEMFKLEKHNTRITLVSPSFCNNQFLPHCKFPSLYLKLEGIEYQLVDPICSKSSSGIGSSLAFSPNMSSAHLFSQSDTDFDSYPKYEAPSFINLSLREAQMPCRAMWCSIM